MIHPPLSFTTQDRTDQNLDAALASVSTEIGRTDNKASLLLAFDGAAFAGLAGAGGRHLPLLAQAASGLAIASLAVSAVLLLLVVRPYLADRRQQAPDPGSFLYWAACTPDRIRTEIGADVRPDRLQVLSAIAVRKYRGLRRAVDLALAATGYLVLAAVTTLIGG